MENRPILNSGFTLIELMVVISIMVILATVLILNLSGQRASRDVRIAENQLVSSIRQTQSYTLSERRLPTGQEVQYYLLKFNLANPNQYVIEAMYNVSSAPELQDLQTVSLPPDIDIATITPGSYPIAISRPSMNGDYASTQNLSGSGCALLGFSSPFGKVLINSGCSILNPPNVDTVPSDNDDYGKILNFVANTACASSNNPYGCNVSTDSTMTIILTDTAHTVSKTITVNGITGGVSFN